MEPRCVSIYLFILSFIYFFKQIVQVFGKGKYVFLIYLYVYLFIYLFFVNQPVGIHSFLAGMGSDGPELRVYAHTHTFVNFSETKGLSSEKLGKNPASPGFEPATL